MSYGGHFLVRFRVRSGPSGLSELGGKAILAAGIRRRTGPEKNFLLGPGGIERLKIVRFGIRFRQKPCDHVFVELSLAQLDQCSENCLVDGTAFFKPLAQCGKNM